MQRVISLRRHWPLAAICASYLALAITYSLSIPAWEANDEMDHVANIEFIVRHKTVYPLRYGTWHETHQPPLYYWLVARWQRALRIAPFTVAAPETKTGTPHGPPPQLIYTHNYTARQRAAAVAVHKLRAVSVLLGLATVILTYAIGILSTGRREIALGAAAFVAFLPKFDVVTAAVTNDALVIALCSLAVVLALALRKIAPEQWRRQIAVAALLGGSSGAAIATKLNSIPVVASCIVFAGFARSTSTLGRLRTLVAALFGLGLTTGWWVWMNLHRGTGYLGQEGAREWLAAHVPGLISVVPWTDAERFLKYVPTELMNSLWYRGGWNQFQAPVAINLLLSLFALASWFVAAKAFYQRRFDPALGLLHACSVMGLAAVFIIAKSTTQAEGRIAYVALSSFAVLAVTGTAEAFGHSPKRRKVAAMIWPAVLLLLNLFVLLRFVLPLRAL